MKEKILFSLLSILILTIISPSSRSYSNVTSYQLNQDYTSDKKVPTEYLTIQEAIDAASDGDVISVAAGTYVENINFKGKNIIVQSQDGPLSTIITPANRGVPIVWFYSGESTFAKLIGFTLKNGGMAGLNGSALRLQGGSHPIIEKCIVKNCIGFASISYYYSGAVLKNCLIHDNTTNLVFHFDASNYYPEIINCTIVDNSDTGSIVGIPLAPKFKNCIIYGNDAGGVSGNCDISYSLVEGGFLGTGNIDADPLFVDASNGDYHLQANSPCIDTGTDFGAPDSDIDGISRPKGVGYDMGAYEAYLPVVLIPYTPDPTNDNTPILDWKDVAGASTYTLQYSDQYDFSTYTEVASITESTYGISDVLSDGTWYWRVRALDSEGAAGWWTAADNFVVDTTPPTVSSTSPADSATGMDVDTPISATFSESMDSITITTDTFTINTSGSNISGSVTYSEKTAIFIPSSNLAKGTTYTATITTGVKDIAGNSMASKYSWSFTTLIPTYALTISAATGGTTDPAPGNYTYNSGTQVTIKAIPSSGYRFSGWSGDVSGTTNPITITMYNDKSVTANFTAIPPEEGKKGGCFIATVAYKSPLHPAVQLLRDFRDKRLLTNGPGRAFVTSYYQWSPAIARIISRSAPLRFVVRILLLPIIGAAALILRVGWPAGLAVWVGGLAIAIKKIRLGRGGKKKK